MSRTVLIAGFFWGAVIIVSETSRNAIIIVSGIFWKTAIAIFRSPGRGFIIIITFRIPWGIVDIIFSISRKTVVIIFRNYRWTVIITLRTSWGIAEIIFRISRKAVTVSTVICIVICIAIILVLIVLPWESSRLIRVVCLIAGGIVFERHSINRVSIHVDPVHVLVGTIIWHLRGGRFAIFQVEAAAVLRIMFCNRHGGKYKDINGSKNHNGCQYTQYAHPPSCPYLPIQYLFASLFGPVCIVPGLIHILLILVVAALVSIISHTLHNARSSQYPCAVPCKIIHPDGEVNRVTFNVIQYLRHHPKCITAGIQPSQAYFIAMIIW